MSVKQPDAVQEVEVPRMKRRTKAFADHVINNPEESATKAYLATHETSNRAAAAVEASKLLSKPSVMIYMNEHLALAKGRIVDIVRDGKDEHALRAAQDILDREYGKATQRVETRSEVVSINIKISPDSQEPTGVQ